MIKHPAALLMVALFFFSCNNTPAVKVARIGELDDLINKGDMKTNAHLQDYASSEHLYGLGMVTGLNGFIQIIDGKPYISRLVNGKLSIDSSFNGDATLLLLANVTDWKEFDLPPEVKTWKQLEQFIGNQATIYHVPRNCASPFLLKGIATDAKWRVINWDPNDKEVTYKKTIEAGLHGELQNEYITAIGFYSRESDEVLTHKETNIQIHFVNHDHSLAGHLDDLTIDGNMKLFLPKILAAKKN